MKLLGYLVGLVVFGAVVFVGFAALVAYREGRPLSPPAEAQVSQGETARQPLAALTVGAHMSSATAWHFLERGARSEAVYALDAAMRAVEVGKHAAHGKRQEAFKQALKDMKQARHTLQNGKPTSAEHHLEAAVVTLEAAAKTALADDTVPPAPETWNAYQDAVLLNALGVRIGEVDRIRLSENGPPEAVLMLGGGQDVLGLFDLGGTELIIPVNTLLFGKRQTIGAVLVVLPTFASSAPQIENTAPVAWRNLTH